MAKIITPKPQEMITSFVCDICGKDNPNVYAHFDEAQWNPMFLENYSNHYHRDCLISFWENRGNLVGAVGEVGATK